MFFSLQHSAGVNCLAVLKSLGADGCDYLFTGSRDGTLKRWALMEDAATCSTTLESHVDWVLFAYHLFFSFLICTLTYKELLQETFDASIMQFFIR